MARTKNRLVLNLDTQRMTFAFASGLSTVNANSLLANEFVVRPTPELDVDESLWVQFYKAGQPEQEPLLMVKRRIQPTVEEIETETQFITVVEQVNTGWEYYVDIPPAVILVAGEWEFALAIRVVEDLADISNFIQVATTSSDGATFTVKNSIINTNNTVAKSADVAAMWAILQDGLYKEFEKEFTKANWQQVGALQRWVCEIPQTEHLLNKPRVTEVLLQMTESGETFLTPIVCGVRVLSSNTVKVYVELDLSTYSNFNGKIYLKGE